MSLPKHAHSKQAEPNGTSHPPGDTALTGEQLRGQLPGDRYVRVIRRRSSEFEQAGPGLLVATEETLAPSSPAGRLFGWLKRVSIGRPLPTAAASHERLTKVKALAVLSSDALSSVAYGTEAVLAILILAGAGALWVNIPISLAIVALIIIVGASYSQTLRVYQSGGGSYSVAKDNLGEIPALTAAAALLIDYVLTVAVSVSSGVAALISAVPALHRHLVGLGLFFIILVTALNLRGVREAGTIFATPTYLFITGIIAMICVGIARNAIAGFPVQHPPTASIHATEGLGLFLVLRAFASGCSAMTGVEAISNGIPAFKPPEWRNARTTLRWMVSILAIMFFGISFLAHQYGARPFDPATPGYQTVVSQIAQSVLWGRNAAYYYVQFTTLAILVLAANTSFADFPRLSYVLARDRYMPHQFSFRGDRLAFTTGIVTLGLLSGALLAGFGGDTDRLIPLYAVGVFVSFTLNQSGMVRRWWTRREPGWQHSLPINLVGAIATGLVAIIIASTKFTHGAWIVVILIPILIVGFRGINRHYQRVERELEGPTVIDPAAVHLTAIVPVAELNSVSTQTLAYARSISRNVFAVHVTDDEDEIRAWKQTWAALGADIQLVIIESPNRSLVGPLLTYLDELTQQRPGETISVILPELQSRHWWEQLLHNQSALRLKAALLFRPGTVVTSVPYRIRHRPHAIRS